MSPRSEPPPSTLYLLRAAIRLTPQECEEHERVFRDAAKAIRLYPRQCARLALRVVLEEIADTGRKT